MKTFHILILCLFFSSSLAADTPALGKPRLDAVITCFNGPDENGAFCVSPFSAEANDLRCGSNGKFSELHWDFVSSKPTGDVWRISRRLVVDSSTRKSEQKTITFAGARITVFRDEFHVVVIDPAPAKK